MITIEKLKVYQEYKGDIDVFGRIKNAKGKDIINEVDFYIIDDLAQDYYLIRMDLCSLEFVDNFKRKIDELCIPEEVTQVLLELRKVKS